MSLLQLLERGEVDQAKSQAQARLIGSPADAEAQLTIARLTAAEGRLDEAELLLNQLSVQGELAVQIRLTQMALLSARQ